MEKFYRERSVDVKNEPVQKSEHLEKKKKVSSLTVFVVFSIAALIIYTVVDKIIFIKLGISDPTLTTAFFGFFGGEVITCALIKIFKLKRNSHENIDSI